MEKQKITEIIEDWIEDRDLNVYHIGNEEVDDLVNKILKEVKDDTRT